MKSKSYKFINLKVNILGISLFFSLFSCQDSIKQKEIELLKQEIELLKREIEYNKKEQETFSYSKEVNENTLIKDNSPVVSKIKVEQNDVRKAFEQNLKTIEGEDGYCEISNNNILIGDINNDGLVDGLVYYSCSLRGNIGNASYSGIAIFINKTNKLHLLEITEGNILSESFMIPKKISSGIIYLEKYEYDSGDPNCCPSIITSIKMKLIDNNLVIIN